MEYVAKKDGRLGETVFLRVTSEVIKYPGIMFAPDVSNKSGVELLTLQQASASMDFPVVYDRTNWKDPEVQARLKAADKFELLVPDSVPLALLSGF